MEDIKIDSVYFERKRMLIGTGATARKKDEDLHYYVKENSVGVFEIEVLSSSGRRTGVMLEVIDRDSFLERFFSCYEHECAFFPKLSEEESKEKALKHTENGERHKEKNNMKMAELEFGTALKFNESSALANYGMAKVLLETGRLDKGRNILIKLTKIDAVFDKENKHLFNEIGIDLRKQGLYDEAYDYYNKAISIDSEDEALFYNLARLLKDIDKYQEAIETIKKALIVNPDFREGRELLSWLESKL